jgi:hypothetical protein
MILFEAVAMMNARHGLNAFGVDYKSGVAPKLSSQPQTGSRN